MLPRQLLVIDGEARYDWTHGISVKKNKIKVDRFDGVEYPRERRIAITFRRVIL